MDGKERLKGCLLGVAIGDFLGTEIELGKGRVTDDTMLTLAVAEGIVECAENPVPCIGKGFIRWYEEDGFGVGRITATAIEQAMTMDSWDYGAKMAHDLFEKRSAGNGSLMRTAPVGHLYEKFEDALFFSGRISDMTHYDIKGKEACNLYTWLIYLLKQGVTREDALKEVIDFHVIYGSYQMKEEDELQTTAYVEDTLLTSLWVFNRAESFKDGIIKSVSLGGDRDTIGAVTGGLLGTYYGTSQIPQEYIEKIEDTVIARIERITEEVYRC